MVGRMVRTERRTNPIHPLKQVPLVHRARYIARRIYTYISTCFFISSLFSFLRNVLVKYARGNERERFAASFASSYSDSFRRVKIARCDSSLDLLIGNANFINDRLVVSRRFFSSSGSFSRIVSRETFHVDDASAKDHRPPSISSYFCRIELHTLNDTLSANEHAEISLPPLNESQTKLAKRTFVD